MSKRRSVITAVLADKSRSEVARRYGVGPLRKSNEPGTSTEGSGHADVLRHHMVELAGIEPASSSAVPGLLRVQSV